MEGQEGVTDEDNISGNTCPEAGAFGELSYWKILADSMQEVSDLIGCFLGCGVWGEPDWVLAEGPSLPHFEYAKSVLGTLASGESCHPVVHLEASGWSLGSWQGTGSLSRASQKFYRHKKSLNWEVAGRSGNRPGVVVVSEALSGFPCVDLPQGMLWLLRCLLLTSSTTLIWILNDFLSE